jgi:chitinase
VADVLVSEGNSGTKNAVFAVSLSAASTSTVTVSYATANGTAAAPGDYAAKTGTLTFTPGQTAKTVTVLVNGDTAVEPDEVFTLNLTGPTGATLGDGTATGTIQNNDVVAPASSLSITDVTKAEGPKGTTTSFTFKVTLSAARSASTTVRVATANGTATTAGLDYTAKTATVTIPAGVVTKNFTVKVTGDRKIEANETFVVNLSNPTGATIADAQGLGTIINDD